MTETEVPTAIPEGLQRALDKLDTFDLKLERWAEGPSQVSGRVEVDEADLAELLSLCREVLRQSYLASAR